MEHITYFVVKYWPKGHLYKSLIQDFDSYIGAEAFSRELGEAPYIIMQVKEIKRNF